MWVKICGITNKPDAVAVIEAGADALGFVFAPSPRRISAQSAGRIAGSIKGILKVGVFVNPALDEVNTIRRQCKLDVVQLHGEETPQFCNKVGGCVVKAIRLGSEKDLETLDTFRRVWKILLDARHSGARGGTGRAIPPALLDEVADFSNVILAGGVSADNGADLAARYRPFGLDCSSGVESSPGVKDHGKITRFIQTVKGMDSR